VWTGDAWVEAESVEPERETATICPGCCRELQAIGLTR
jgi:hypothetical protein